MAEEGEVITHTAVEPWYKTLDKKKSKNAVKAHTPDPTKYHRPDDRQGSRMAGGMVGATMIPRSTPDGGSMGFVHKPSIVHVDPDYPDGVIIDPQRLKAAAIDKTLSEVNNRVPYGRDDEEGQEITSALFRELGAQGAAVDSPRVRRAVHTTEAVRSNPHVPGAYVTPKANDGVGPRQAPRRAAAAPVAAMQPVLDTPEDAEPETLPPDPDLQELKEIMDGTQNATILPGAAPTLDKPGNRRAVDRGVTEEEVLPPIEPHVSGQPRPKSAVRSKFRAKQAAAPQPLQEEIMEERNDEATEGDDMASPQSQEEPVPPAMAQMMAQMLSMMQTIAGKTAAGASPMLQQKQRALAATKQVAAEPAQEVPVCFGPEPTRPKNRVVFNMGEGGTIATRYHAVIHGAGCVVLVYDNRYDGGDQFIPPTRREPVSLHLSDKDGSKEPVKVMSLGIQFALGWLDVLVLIEDDEETPATPPADGP